MFGGLSGRSVGLRGGDHPCRRRDRNVVRRLGRCSRSADRRAASRPEGVQLAVGAQCIYWTSSNGKVCAVAK